MSGFFAPSVVSNERPAGLMPKCGACGLFKGCESPKMEVHGEGKKRVLVVGTAPDEDDDTQGRPFAGRAGDFLRGHLDAIGVDLDEDAWSTNALICHSKAAPDPKQIDYCRPNLHNTLSSLSPRVVVLLGRAAVQSVLPTYWKGSMDTLERWVGWQIPGPDFWICPTYHPKFLMGMKNELMDRCFREDLKRAFAIEEGTHLPEMKNPPIRLLYELGDIEREVWRFVDKGGWVAVDYETNCLKPEYEKARIFSCALSDGQRTISFPWGHEASAIMGNLFRCEARKIASNLKFEERWTRAEYGHGVRNWGWDTMLAAHCLDNRPGICSLKFQSWVQLGVPTYNANVAPYLESSNGPYNRIHEIALDDLLHYGGMDALLEYRLAMRQRKEMGFTDNKA